MIDSVQYALIEALLLIGVGMCCINSHWITDDTANTGHEKNYRNSAADWMRTVLVIDVEQVCFTVMCVTKYIRCRVQESVMMV